MKTTNELPSVTVTNDCTPRPMVPAGRRRRFPYLERLFVKNGALTKCLANISQGELPIHVASRPERSLIFRHPPLTMVWTIVVTLTILLVSLPQATSQSSGVTCMASFSWASNSLKQSPCLVAAYLLGTCSGGAHEVPPLPDNKHYVGPTTATADACQCNTVVYSLMSACGECQNRTISGWGEWSANCPHVDINVFPGEIPAGTRVPGWAYLDVKANDAFDDNLAKANANSTESAAPQPTSSSTSSSRHSATGSVRTSSTSSAAPSPISTSAPTATNASSSSATSDNSHRIDQIIGGTIGGVFALGILGFIWLYFFRKRRDSVGQQQLESQTTSQEQVDIPEMKGPPAPATVVSPDIVVDGNTKKH